MSLTVILTPEDTPNNTLTNVSGVIHVGCKVLDMFAINILSNNKMNNYDSLEFVIHTERCSKYSLSRSNCSQHDRRWFPVNAA